MIAKSDIPEINEITLKHLQVFRAIVDNGSLTSAATALGVSQPTISLHLSKFEQLLGEPLISRTPNNRMELTQAGTHWYKSSVHITTNLEASARDFLEKKSRYKRTLRVFVTAMASRAHLPAKIINDKIKSISNTNYDSISFEFGTTDLNTRTQHHDLVIFSDLESTNYSKSYNSIGTIRVAFALAIPRGTTHTLSQPELTNTKLDYINVTQPPNKLQPTSTWFKNNMPYASAVATTNDYAFAKSLSESLRAAAILPKTLAENLCKNDFQIQSLDHDREHCWDVYFGQKTI